MRLSIILPHFRVGRVTAYAVSQFIKCCGKHEVDIWVIDNSYGDPSIEYLRPFGDRIKIFNHITDKTNSHGIAYDAIVPRLRTEYFIAAENDSFPTIENWLDYYEHIIADGYDSAGSLLQLSGGLYSHPAGCLYRKSIWQQCKRYCDNIDYFYFPNMAMKEKFPCHLMVRKDIVNKFLADPEQFIELSDSYKPYTPQLAEQKCAHYSPVVNPFHNGMWATQESYSTYGRRSVYSEPPHIPLDHADPIIFRMGAEPGQYFNYWMIAANKKVGVIPTETIWMPNREHQQQERTVMENGFTHLWAVSAYHKSENKDVQDIVKYKAELVDSLYDSMPDEYKIKTPPEKMGA